MPVPENIVRLVETFDRNHEAYTSGRYNETQVRREFVDPMFIELGWDINNTKGYAEAYKDVIHEDSIRIGGVLKAPDYCFRIGDTRKFFVEAKKPSVNIKGDPNPAFQIRRYAWSSKLPLSILTDFEEFAVYDCRVRPLKNDKASKSRTTYIKYTEYIERWDEIASVFSRDAVLKGSFDKFAQSKKRKGTAEVDDAFLAEIDSWRETLAKNIALRNPKLTIRQLNFAVQKTIDRIIFLRIAEDRGIEQYRNLTNQINGNDVYQRLLKIFGHADDRYNSGLFHFTDEKDRTESPDELTPSLIIDDKPLRDIIRSLYPPDCPYEFSVLPIEILGNVYEQFLGKVITLTTGHRARIEEKPEVKKAGGVYYTPSYIVDYIVENTVGKLTENKTPTQLSKIKILDPACGSGSFLLGAYKYLLDWHLKYYSDNEPAKWLKGKTPRITEIASVPPIKTTKSYKLTITERKRILLSNIFGVDIDSQAVEVTKLSLLLKVLEGEKQLVLFERALPDLANNIKCGNSLIASDFYQNQQLTMFDEEEQYKINVFDWEKAYPKIFNKTNPGFDAVIGNPPWGALFSNLERAYLVGKFPRISTKTKDSYFYFVSQALHLLLPSAMLGFIIPNTWLLINYAEQYRRFILSLDIIEIRDHGDGVFKKAVVESATLLLRHSPSITPSCKAVRLRRNTIVTDHVVDKSLWTTDPLARINLEIDERKFNLVNKLFSSAQSFDCSGVIKWGIKPYQTGHGIPPQTKAMITARIYHSETKRDDTWKPLLVGRDVDRYRLSYSGNQFIKYGKNLMYPSDESLILAPKLLVRQTSDIIRAVYDDASYYCQNSMFIISSNAINLKFLLGILNSRLLNFAYALKNPQVGKILAEIKPSVIKELPIQTINFSNPTDKSRHDKMVSLVELMLELNKKLPKAKTAHEKTILQRQITSTDDQIDQLVYELYDLTEEEIKIVKNSTK